MLLFFVEKLCFEKKAEKKVRLASMHGQGLNDGSQQSGRVSAGCTGKAGLEHKLE